MTPDDLAAIRARDAAAADCATCGMAADMPHHGPVEYGCPEPRDHHSHIRGDPREDAESDRRALLAEVDRLEARLADQDASCGQHQMGAVAAERARIHEKVEGLPDVTCSRYHEHTDKTPQDLGVSRAAVLAAIDGEGE